MLKVNKQEQQERKAFEQLKAELKGMSLSEEKQNKINEIVLNYETKIKSLNEEKDFYIIHIFKDFLQHFKRQWLLNYFNLNTK